MLRHRADELSVLIRALAATGEGAPTLESKLEALRAARARCARDDREVDRALIEEVATLRGCLREAERAQAELREMVEKLTAPPLRPVIYLGERWLSGYPAALVGQGSMRRVVPISDDVDSSCLEVGDEVLLSDMNVVAGHSPERVPQGGETAVVERITSDGRLVLRARDELVVAARSAAINGNVSTGDLVRWDRELLLVFEKLEQSRGEGLFLEDTPRESFAQIGGLESQIELLQRSIILQREHPELAARYGLRPRVGVLLVGPPGTGKTMLARALAHWLAERSPGRRVRFAAIKPQQLGSMWYSQTEANYREAFRAAREAAMEDPDGLVVMFFDEVDAIGATRGETVTHVDDRVLTAFMAELDGFDGRMSNVLVIGATNRVDAIDPGLLRPGRLGDAIIEVPRPNRRAAAEIFRKHLRADVPMAGARTPEDARSARDEAIDAVLSRIYAANGESDFARVQLRGGEWRAVAARDLVSGALIARIVGDAVEAAARREIRGGGTGLEVDDLLVATDDAFGRSARVLTRWNCRRHIEGLPDDVDVVSVVQVERRMVQPQRFLADAASV